MGNMLATLIQMGSMAVFVMILAVEGDQIRKHLGLFILLCSNYVAHLVGMIVVVLAFPAFAVGHLQTSLLFTSLILYLMLFFRLVERFELFVKSGSGMRFRDLGIGGLSLVGAILPFFIVFFQADKGHTNSALFQILMAFVCISLTIVYMFRRQKERQKYEQEQLYMLDVEKRQLEIRRFRHDYLNVLLTLQHYFEGDDLQGMKRYFDEEIMPTGKFLMEQNIELGNLGNLCIPEIKSLCSVKLMEAQSYGIETIVEIPSEIRSMNMKYSVLARILGILLDNAVEECCCLEGSMLHMGIFEHKGRHQIIIKNTCRDNKLTPRQMFEKGFSTKGRNRGLGLSNVRALLDRMEDATIKTINENGHFIQELEIKRGERL